MRTTRHDVVRESREFAPSPIGDWDGVSRAEALRRLLEKSDGPVAGARLLDEGRPTIGDRLRRLWRGEAQCTGS